MQKKSEFEDDLYYGQTFGLLTYQVKVIDELIEEILTKNGEGCAK